MDLIIIKIIISLFTIFSFFIFFKYSQQIGNKISLLDKDRILAISKSDMLDEELKKEIAKELPKDLPSLFISSVAQKGLTKLKDLIWEKLNK